MVPKASLPSCKQLPLPKYTSNAPELTTTSRSGIFFFVGPVLLLFSMVAEWIMGNFFPMMVMGLFAVFWLSFGMLQLPTLELGVPFSSSTDPSGLGAPSYNAAIALYLLVWGFALFTFFIFTCKINAVFAAIFLLVSVASWVLSGAYWKVVAGDFDAAGKLQKVFPHSSRNLVRFLIGRLGNREAARCFSSWRYLAGT